MAITKMKNKINMPNTIKALKFIAVAIVFIVISCTMNPQPLGNSTTTKFGDFNIKIIDSCEYVEFDSGFGEQRVYSIAHKGNCKFCKQRNISK